MRAVITAEIWLIAWLGSPHCPWGVCYAEEAVLSWRSFTAIWVRAAAKLLGAAALKHLVGCRWPWDVTTQVACLAGA